MIQSLVLRVPMRMMLIKFKRIYELSVFVIFTSKDSIFKFLDFVLLYYFLPQKFLNELLKKSLSSDKKYNNILRIGF